MTLPADRSTQVLQNLLNALPQDERDQIALMERVKSRVLRTHDRDGVANAASPS